VGYGDSMLQPRRILLFPQENRIEERVEVFYPPAFRKETDKSADRVILVARLQPRKHDTR
jgi:hypothetical protein